MSLHVRLRRYQSSRHDNPDRGAFEEAQQDMANTVIHSLINFISFPLYLMYISIDIWLIVKHDEGGECGNKLRGWVYGHITYIGASFLIRLYKLFQDLDEEERKSRFEYIVGLFSFIWWIFGMILVFGDMEYCKDITPELYKLVFAWSIINILLLSVICWLSCLLIIFSPCIWGIVRLLMLITPEWFTNIKSADNETINNLETMPYMQGKLRHNQMKCCICLDEYSDHITVKILPCEHAFHPDCIDKWLRTNCKCPLCQSDVRSGGDLEAGEVG